MASAQVTVIERIPLDDGQDQPKSRRKFVPAALTEAFSDAASQLDRRLIWALELLALTALGLCLGLISRVHEGPGALALGIATTYFAISSGLGAYLLKIDPR